MEGRVDGLYRGKERILPDWNRCHLSFLPTPLRQLHASLDANGLKKDTRFMFREGFRIQFLCYTQLLKGPELLAP
jgi:hypothetical protein